MGLFCLRKFLRKYYKLKCCPVLKRLTYSYTGRYFKRRAEHHKLIAPLRLSPAKNVSTLEKKQAFCKPHSMFPIKSLSYNSDLIVNKIAGNVYYSVWSQCENKRDK